MRDCTQDAKALFARFAQRHGLQFDVDASAPVEVLWRFPEQEKLSHAIILGLQNGDELNFGVGEFWSYYFPFDEKWKDFEAAIDAWIAGDARITPASPWTYALQVRQDRGWSTVYSASQLFPSFRHRPTISNSRRDVAVRT